MSPSARLVAARRRAPVLVLLALLLPAASAVAESATAAPPLLAPLSDGQQVALPELDPAIPSPAQHLGYPLGARFTRHAEMLRYLEALDAASPRVAMWRYGTTYEERPLVLLAISSEANIARLDELRAERALLDRAGALAGDEERRLGEAPAVVWLGYGVHGNESSSAEAALAAAYALAAGRGPGAPDLDRLVVLLDPLVNPDGRERFLAGHLARRGAEPDPHPDALEHFEPWPGGRGNHYFLDLNRDWAWATQVETRARVAEMAVWEPQVYVDFHEMGADSTYFFPPAADPHHPAFDSGVRRWFETFGRGNAEAFDRQGWTYYVGEEFDLFYPAYGDTYPTLRGGLGMTYEVAGGGRSGSLIELPGTGRWSLADRIARHLTTSLATVATAAANARELVASFAERRTRQARGPGRTFVWPAGEGEGDALAELLASHGIAVGRLRRGEEVEAQPLAGGAPRKQRLAAGSWAVTTAQPLGALAAALLERQADLPEAFLARQRERAAAHLLPEFYDVTAWSLPLAYNVRAWTTAASVAIGYDDAARTPAAQPAPEGRARVGYLVPPAGLSGYRLAAALLRRDIPFRVAVEPLTVGGRELPAGTLFVPRAGRRELEAELVPLAREAGVELVAADSSLTAGGIPLGSERMVPVAKGRIGLLAGPGIDSSSFGALWHLFDRDLGLAHSVLPVDRLGDVDLGRLDVLVMPDGFGYARALGEADRTRLVAWVKQGGVLVALPGAIEWLHDAELVSVAPRELDAPHASGDETEGGAAAEADSDRIWDTQLFVPGAIVETKMRARPLTVGVAGPPPVLFWGDTFYEPTGDPLEDLLLVDDEEPLVAGVVWPEARDHLAGAALMVSERQGRGKVVVFTQDPAFRLFWRGTMPLLLNAVLYGRSL